MTRWAAVWVASLVLLQAAGCIADPLLTKRLSLRVPGTVLKSVTFDARLQLSPMMRPVKGSRTVPLPWPDTLNWTLSLKNSGIVLSSGQVQVYADGSQVAFDKGLLLTSNTELDSFGESQVKIQVTCTDPETGKILSFSDDASIFVIPGFLSVLPSIITVVIAMWLRQNILALFIGVWVGAALTHRYNFFTALLRTLDAVVIKSLADSSHAAVIYFCLLVGGMIAVIGKGGGASGMAQSVTRFATSRRRGQLVTWCIGVLTFFDDYASCLITGSTMRDVAASLKISREKLSFIVDTCAATVSSLFFVSSWIGVEVSYIKEQFKDIGIMDDAYMTFLMTIPYRFYPIFVLVFALILIVTGRDFGPMLKAERRALFQGKLVADGAKPMVEETDEMQPKEDKPKRWWNAVIPFVLIVTVIPTGMLLEGYWNVKALNDPTIEMSIPTLLEHCVSYHALLWGSFAASLVAILLVVCQRILTLSEAMDAWLSGCKSMIFALLILIHAWALGDLCHELQTAGFVASALRDNFNPGWLPMIVFLLGAIVSFSTGSAWGTMSILFPLVVPLTHRLAPGNKELMLGCISSILSGSVWGNHASPISDSCIMSSMSTGCDHNDHVHTQAVYAVVIGFVAVLFGSIPVGLGGYSSGVGLLMGLLVMILIVFAFGERVDVEHSEMPIVSWLAAIGVTKERVTALEPAFMKQFRQKCSSFWHHIRRSRAVAPEQKPNDEESPSAETELNVVTSVKLEETVHEPSSSSRPIYKEHYLSMAHNYDA